MRPDWAQCPNSDILFSLEQALVLVTDPSLNSVVPSFKMLSFQFQQLLP